MIQGMVELGNKLDKISDADIKTAVGKCIKLVQANAKQLCPVGDSELRTNIFATVDEYEGGCRGTCYTNKKYGPYVEFGTGPKGQASHDGISPDVTPAYSLKPWWIHESQIDKETAEKYHWFKLETPDGIFYQCTGQAAQPFMYPALKNNVEQIIKKFQDETRGQLKT